jgi:hypothetical protein
MSDINCETIPTNITKKVVKYKLSEIGLKLKSNLSRYIEKTLSVNKRIPRKRKKAMKKKYQSTDANYKITGSLYDGVLLGTSKKARYKGKIRNWKTLDRTRL